MNLKSLTPHLVAIGIFLLTVIVLFLPQFQGKGLQQGDVVQYRGAARELTEYSDTTGRRLNWTNTMFGGMPTYQIKAVTAGNQLKKAGRLFYGFMGGPAGFVFCGMLCFYLMLVLLGVSPWIALAGAIPVAIATNNIVLYSAGHTSKLAVIMYLPLVAAGVLLAFRRRYWVGGAMFALGMGLSIMANHPQMLYYFGLTLGFFGVAELVRHARQGTLAVFGKAMGALLLGLALAIGAGASNLLTTTEYLPQSIRGGTILTAEASETPGATDNTAAGGGLEWDYAMAWSNGFKDMLATYAPLAAGGGSGQEVTSDTEFWQAMRRAGFNVPRAIPAPLYHGSLPFTEGPIYLGAVVWALFVFGLFTATTTLRVWLGGGTLLLILLSMGSNAAFINRPLFDFLPLLNNFRTPNSALSVATFLMVALGLIGLHRWGGRYATDKLAAGRQLRMAGYTTGALALLVVILGSLIDYSGVQDAAMVARFTQGQGDTNQLVAALMDTRAAVYFDDAMRSLLFVGLTYGALFLAWRGTLSLRWAAIGLGLLALTDFTGINRRYLTHDDFRPRRVVTNPIQPTAADQQIMQDPDPNFRVLNLTRALDKDAMTSYFHKSIGGYSAVKLRRYQDLLDGYLVARDPDVLNMLNTKYFIVPGEGGEVQARRNPNAYGNAWLVSNVEMVADDDAEFAALGEVENLRETAIVSEDFAPALAALDPSGQGSIALTSYSPNELTYRFRSPSAQLAVFSEIWYGPDLGWEATIDGEPAELIRANYALRALPVPAGEHIITMRFSPTSFSLGRTISFICSVLIVLAVVLAIVWPYWKGRGGDAGAGKTGRPLTT
jgi:hypothetical protein